MTFISTIEELESHYGTPSEASLVKVAGHLTPLYREWIMASRFCVLTTVGPEGTDGSPRGDVGPVVTEIDPQTLAMPDWRGNNRMDSLRNIVTDGRVSLMFMVPGSTTIVRVNGQAKLTADADMCQRFEQAGAHPRTVILIKISEVYTQCARAVMRAELWPDTPKPNLPTAGDILAEMTDGRINGQAYDKAWPDRAKSSMW